MERHKGKLAEEIDHASLFLLLLNLGRLRLLTRVLRRSSSGRRGRSSNLEGIRVGQHVLELLDLLEADVGSNGNGNEVLVRVDDDVREGSNRGDVGGQGQRGDTGETSREVVEDILVSDVENLNTYRNTSQKPEETHQQMMGG